MTSDRKNGKRNGRVRLSNGSSLDQKGNVRDTLTHSEYEYVYGDGARKLYDRLNGDESGRSIYDRAETDVNVSRPGSKRFLQNVDMRSLRARQLKANYDLIVQDLGGIDNITLAQSEIARKCATMAVLAQEMEAAMVMNDKVNFDFDQYIIVARAQASLFRTLGIDRKQRDVTGDTLDNYVRRQKGYENWRGRNGG